MYTIYGKKDCYGCEAAKALVNQAQQSYEYVDITSNPEARQKLFNLGFRSVPVIFNSGELVGSLADLRRELGQ